MSSYHLSSRHLESFFLEEYFSLKKTLCGCSDEKQLEKSHFSTAVVFGSLVGALGSIPRWTFGAGTRSGWGRDDCEGDGFEGCKEAEIVRAWNDLYTRRH